MSSGTTEIEENMFSNCINLKQIEQFLNYYSNFAAVIIIYIIKQYNAMKKLVLSVFMVVAVLIAFAQPKIEFDKKTHDFGNIKEE